MSEKKIFRDIVEAWPPLTGAAFGHANSALETDIISQANLSEDGRLILHFIREGHETLTHVHVPNEYQEVVGNMVNNLVEKTFKEIGTIQL